MRFKELEELKASIPDYNGQEGWTEINLVKKLKVQCIEMINSIIIYGGDLYSSDFLEQYKAVLGDSFVLSLILEQERYFKEHVRILKDVVTDSEGISYNSVEEYGY